MGSEPTLIELLASEAEHLDFRAAGIETLGATTEGGEAVKRLRVRAARLRAAAERLRSEMGRHWFAGPCECMSCQALQRVNGAAPPPLQEAPPGTPTERGERIRKFMAAMGNPIAIAAGALQEAPKCPHGNRYEDCCWAGRAPPATELAPTCETWCGTWIPSAQLPAGATRWFEDGNGCVQPICTEPCFASGRCLYPAPKEPR